MVSLKVPIFCFRSSFLLFISDGRKRMMRMSPPPPYILHSKQNVNDRREAFIVRQGEREINRI